jgi:hypothetical protein
MNSQVFYEIIPSGTQSKIGLKLRSKSADEYLPLANNDPAAELETLRLLVSKGPQSLESRSNRYSEKCRQGILLELSLLDYRPAEPWILPRIWPAWASSLQGKRDS